MGARVAGANSRSATHGKKNGPAEAGPGYCVAEAAPPFYYFVSSPAADAPRGGIFRLRIIDAASTVMTTPSDTYTGIL